jgi:hypothetical protein
MALVPLVQSASWLRTPPRDLPRPDSTFVTHLIATAEHMPQTRSLRRATPLDARIAYTRTSVGCMAPRSVGSR